jgi:hypothetical protein
MLDMGRVGFPIGEFSRDGTVTLGKLPGTGGRVDQFTVKEHLLYEIGDPANYLGCVDKADKGIPPTRCSVIRS